MDYSDNDEGVMSVLPQFDTPLFRKVDGPAFSLRDFQVIQSLRVFI